MAKDGSAGVILGTRSAIFAPMPNLGLIIIDEEHDTSFKQQSSFRYSASTPAEPSFAIK
jgi:primosomal protein N' (replication factor Y)